MAGRRSVAAQQEQKHGHGRPRPCLARPVALARRSDGRKGCWSSRNLNVQVTEVAWATAPYSCRLWAAVCGDGRRSAVHFVPAENRQRTHTYDCAASRQVVRASRGLGRCVPAVANAHRVTDDRRRQRGRFTSAGRSPLDDQCQLRCCRSRCAGLPGRGWGHARSHRRRPRDARDMHGGSRCQEPCEPLPADSASATVRRSPCRCMTCAIPIPVCTRRRVRGVVPPRHGHCVVSLRGSGWCSIARRARFPRRSLRLNVGLASRAVWRPDVSVPCTAPAMASTMPTSLLSATDMEGSRTPGRCTSGARLWCPAG